MRLRTDTPEQTHARRNGTWEWKRSRAQGAAVEVSFEEESRFGRIRALPPATAACAPTLKSPLPAAKGQSGLMAKKAHLKDGEEVL